VFYIYNVIQIVFKELIIDHLMSYIPKYVLKRMIPADAIKLVGDFLEITFINILTPVQIKTLPANYLDYISFIVDGTPLDQSIMEQVIFTLEDKEIPLSNPFAANNLLVPVGAKLFIKVPNPGFQQGETHKIDVKIADYQRFNFSVERTIQ
jgi:hypothetical protein